MSKFLKALGRKEIITPHLDRWFDRMKPKVGDISLPISLVKEEDTYFHPSSHTTGCARTIFKAFDPHFAEENGRRSFNNKVMANGHLWHALLEHVIVNELEFADSFEVPLWAARSANAESSVRVYQEDPKSMNGNLWVAKGTLDIPYVCPPGSPQEYVVDIKTMNPESFGLERPPEYLWQKYVAQMQLYLDWTDTDRGILLCVKAANPFDFKEIVIERDHDHASYIYLKWDKVATALALGIPPEHTCMDADKCPSNEWYT